MRRFAASIVLFVALSFAGFAVALPFAGVVYHWVTAAEINAQGWDTSHAGEPMPPEATAGTVVYSLNFPVADPLCTVVTDESQTNNGQSTTAPLYIEQTVGQGNAGLQFVNKATALANGNLLCAAGYLQMTASNPTGSEWDGVKLKTHPYGATDPKLGGIQYGLWSVEMSLPAPDGVAIPFCPNPVGWWFANWGHNKPQVVATKVWHEPDDPETGVQSTTACQGRYTADFHPPNAPGYPQPGNLQSEIKLSQTLNYQLFSGHSNHHVIAEWYTHDYIKYYLDGRETERLYVGAMGNEVHDQYYDKNLDMGLHDPTNVAYSAAARIYSIKGIAALPGSCGTVAGGC